MKTRVVIIVLLLLALISTILTTVYFSTELNKFKNKESDVVTRTFYLRLSDDDTKSKELIDSLKSDYHFKPNDKTGNWKMITNEEVALKDKLFVVTLMSYEGDQVSIDTTNEFSFYLTSWYKFQELEDDWSVE